jgi:hypothetical protein
MILVGLKRSNWTIPEILLLYLSLGETQVIAPT